MPSRQQSKRRNLKERRRIAYNLLKQRSRSAASHSTPSVVNRCPISNTSSGNSFTVNLPFISDASHQPITSTLHPSSISSLLNPSEPNQVNISFNTTVNNNANASVNNNHNSNVADGDRRTSASSDEKTEEIDPQLTALVAVRPPQERRVFGRENAQSAARIHHVEEFRNLNRRRTVSQAEYCRQKGIDRKSFNRWIKEGEQIKKRIKEQPHLANSSRLVRESYPITMAALREKVDDFCSRGGQYIGHLLDAQFLTLLEKTPEEMLAFRERYNLEGPLLLPESFSRTLRSKLQLSLVVHGEGSSVDIEDVNQGKAEVCEVLRGYSEADIYNTDESALFINLMRSQGLSNLKTVEKGFKQDKNRITFLIITNMTGTDLEVSFVGKSAKPRCFEKKTPSELGISYYSNVKGWMTRKIFTDIIKRFDMRMKSEGRHVILTMDNFAGHKLLVHSYDEARSFIINKNVESYVALVLKDGETQRFEGDSQITQERRSEGIYIPKHVKIFFLRANTTSSNQPLDQGIISNIKGHYNTLKLKKAIDLFSNMRPEEVNALKKVDCLFKSDILECMQLLEKSSRMVKPRTITNCFLKAGFRTSLMENSSDVTQVINVSPECDGLKDIRMSIENMVSSEICDETKHPGLFGAFRDSENYNYLLLNHESNRNISDTQASLVMDEVILDVSNRTRIYTGNYKDDEISDIEVVEMARKSLGLDSLLSKDELNELDILRSDDELTEDSDDMLLKDTVRFPSVMGEIKSDTLKYRRALRFIESFHYMYPRVARNLSGANNVDIVISTQDWLFLNKQIKKLRQAHRTKISRCAGFQKD